jgi:hypothetical protein
VVSFAAYEHFEVVNVSQRGFKENTTADKMREALSIVTGHAPLFCIKGLEFCRILTKEFVLPSKFVVL